MNDLQDVFATGIPAQIDQDPFEGEQISALAAQIIHAQELARTRSTQLFIEWCSLPNITLEQAAWLLLECDPWKPTSRAGLANEQLQIDHVKVRNRLECEVGRWLAPLKPYLPGLPLRFYVADIARAAQAIALETVAARLLAEINAKATNGAPPTSATRAQQRVAERLSIHRLLINDLATRKPPGTKAIAPKPPSKRRKYAGEPVNMEVLGMTQDRYCEAWNELDETLHPGTPRAAKSYLIEDCRSLNIAFARHRPRGSKDKVKRRRTRR